MKARLLRLSIFANCFRQRSLIGHGLDRSIDAVIARDAIEVPLNHLRDRVAMFAVERMQSVHGDVHEV